MVRSPCKHAHIHNTISTFQWRTSFFSPQYFYDLHVTHGLKKGRNLGSIRLPGTIHKSNLNTFHYLSLHVINNWVRIGRQHKHKNQSIGIVNFCSLEQCWTTHTHTHILPNSLFYQYSRSIPSSKHDYRYDISLKPLSFNLFSSHGHLFCSLEIQHELESRLGAFYIEGLDRFELSHNAIYKRKTHWKRNPVLLGFNQYNCQYKWCYADRTMRHLYIVVGRICMRTKLQVNLKKMKRFRD